MKMLVKAGDAGQALICWWRWLIRGLVLGEAVSPLCPNHVLLCSSVWRVVVVVEGGRERKDKDKKKKS